MRIPALPQLAALRLRSGISRLDQADLKVRLYACWLALKVRLYAHRLYLKVRLNSRLGPGAWALGPLMIVLLVGGSHDSSAPAFASWEPALVGPSQILYAQQPPAPAAETPPPAEWNFDEDEEAEPTWADDVRAQGVDLAFVAGFTVLAFVSFFRKSVRLKYVTLILAVSYLGFYKSQLISIVNVFGIFGGNLPLFRQSLAWYLLVIVTVVSTVLWGRVYCGRICAFGALTQLLDQIVPARWRVNVPRALERRAASIKYVLLGGVILYFLVTGDPSIYPYVEPFWMFGLHGARTPALWIALGALLVTTVFVRNVYCRFLCPVGAALGILSNLTVFRIKRWSECNTCRICEKKCEWGAIRGPKIVLSECVRCDDCERLYEDKTKCPHHLIIIRRPAAMARRAATHASPGAL